MAEKQKVAVFLSSTLDEKHEFVEDIAELGEYLANHYQVVYGGNNMGYMKLLADVVLEKKGKLIGVDPQFFIEKGWIEPRVSELVITQSLSERKEKMLELSDKVIVFPGGLGTLEELADTLSWLALGLIKQPVYVLNLNGYYDGLIQYGKAGLKRNFIKQPVWDKIVFVDSVAQLKTKLYEEDYEMGKTK